MNRIPWKVVVGTAAALVLIVVIAGLAFIFSGAYDVSATSGHSAVTGWILATTSDRSIAAHAGAAPAPPALDSALAARGFREYREECVECHGAPGVKPGELGKGVDPEPPDLDEETGDLSDAELFWITQNGIKYTAMPAFGPSHPDREIWGIVAFLRQLQHMTPADYARWQRAIPPEEEHGRPEQGRAESGETGSESPAS